MKSISQMGCDVSVFFPVKTGLFDVYMDAVGREVNIRVLGTGLSCRVRMVAGLR